MILLSAVIITYNEERNIARCLQSLQGVADDILVLDSYSTDRTAAISRQFGARVIEHTFGGHIQQKNLAITFAKYNYVLSLDADEALSDELRKSILMVKNHFEADGYTMNRLTNYCGKWIKHCGWYPDTKLRLWKSTEGQWGGVNPHDKFIMYSPDARVMHLKGDLLHYSYYTITEHHRQMERYSSIAAQALFEKGEKSNRLKIVYKTLAKFIRNYFVKLGFLDGRFGWIICKNTAAETHMKYTKLMKLWQS